MNTGLPYVDEHSIDISASRDAVWSALEHFVATSLYIEGGSWLGRLLEAEPPGGFDVAASEEKRCLSLAGHHRFARYELVFDLSDASDAPGGATRLRATTYAAFPGLKGSVYRGLVIGTRIHVLATRSMLRRVQRYSHERMRDIEPPIAD